MSDEVEVPVHEYYSQTARWMFSLGFAMFLVVSANIVEALGESALALVLALGGVLLLVLSKALLSEGMSRQLLMKVFRVDPDSPPLESMVVSDE